MKEYLQQSGFLPGLRLEKIFPEKLSAVLAVLFAVLAALAILSDLFLTTAISLPAAKIFAALSLLAGLYRSFLNSLKQPAERTGESLNSELERREYGRFLTFHLTQVLDEADDQNLLSAKAVVAGAFRSPSLRWIVSRLSGPPDAEKRLSEAVAGVVFHPSDLLSKMFERMISAKRDRMGWSDLFLGMADLSDGFRKALFEIEISDADLQSVADWRLRINSKSHRPYWSDNTLLEVKGIGKDWSAGFTPNLDKVSRDLTEEERLYKTPLHMYGHRRYVDMIERTILSGVHNALLVGLPGVGRHTVIKALASSINWGKTYGPLRYARLLQIDSAAVLSHTKTPADALDRIRLLCNEALWAENVILVINDVDAFFDDDSVEIGRINAAEALLPFLKSRLRTIGLTSPIGYQKTIEKNPELSKLFGKVEVVEPSEEETLKILEDESLELEKRSGLEIGYPALKEAASLATKLIQNLPNPEKSLEVLDDVFMYVADKTQDKAITPDHVREAVSQRTRIPVGKVAGQEKDILLNMEDHLSRRIIGQEEAIREVADALRRARAGVRSEKRPIGSFLFLGPTGVGKTETTKALAALYFGSEEKIIRFDMSEFKEARSIDRLIGDSETRQNGLLTEAVISSPFSVILLDELEKANQAILDLFLQVLDDGRLTDAAGRTVNFSNTLIIATSNAGSELIRQMVKNRQTPDKSKILDYLQSQGTYRPEFLNRFDAIVVFSPLSPSDLAKVATLLLAELNARLRDKEISIKITPELAAYVVKEAYSPEFGARPLRRFIQDKFENYIAKGLISGEIARGQVVDLAAIQVSEGPTASAAA
ncbi:MAG: AAA family ATPase [Candidatus Saccharibacteria bacterium]